MKVIGKSRKKNFEKLERDSSRLAQGLQKGIEIQDLKLEVKGYDE